MKVRDRLKQKIQKDLLPLFLLIIFAGISLTGFNAMPKIFIFLVGGIIFLLVEMILLWIQYKKADPLMEEIVADLVIVREVNEGGIALEGRNPVSWSEVVELRKVYRAIGLIFTPGMKTSGVTRRFFYVIRLHDGKWLQLSNINIMAFKGSLKNGLVKSLDAVDLLKQFLTEVEKQAHVRLICHNEAMGRFEALDLRKELEDLSKWEKK